MSSFKVILCHFCESHGPKVLYCSEVKTVALLKTAANDNGKNNRHNQLDNLCPACESVKDNGFASVEPVDPKNCDVNLSGGNIVYKSSRFPTSADDFSHVRQACVKSLSNEVCIGREGFIYFGDSKNGYTFCHTFYLKDSKARGLQRFYSLLAWTRDRYLLINYFSFFRDNFKLVVSSLSVMADKVFASENIGNNSQLGSPASGSSGTSGPLSSLASLQLQRIRRLPTPRSLSELLNCSRLFELLHQQFTWILRNARFHFTEVAVPSWMREVDEDDQVTLSRQQSRGSHELTCNEKNENAGEQNEDTEPEESSNENQVLLLPLRALHELLGADYFIIMCVHTVIGNQVIVRGINQQFVSAIVNTLSKLLPLGCSRVVTDSSVYLEAYQSNLLGLTAEVEIPCHVLDSEMFALLDVLGQGQQLSEYKFEVTSNFYFQRANLPRILVNLEKMLVNTRDFSSYEIIDFYSCMKKQVMSKVKTLYQFVKLSSSPSENDSTVTPLQSNVKVKSEETSAPKGRGAGGLKGQSKVETCLRMLGAGGDNDQLERLLLKFWLNGLSNKYKKDQVKLLATELN